MTASESVSGSPSRSYDLPPGSVAALADRPICPRRASLVVGCLGLLISAGLVLGSISRHREAAGGARRSESTLAFAARPPVDASDPRVRLAMAIHESKGALERETFIPLVLLAAILGVGALQRGLGVISREGIASALVASAVAVPLGFGGPDARMLSALAAIIAAAFLALSLRRRSAASRVVRAPGRSQPIAVLRRGAAGVLWSVAASGAFMLVSHGRGLLVLREGSLFAERVWSVFPAAFIAAVSALVLLATAHAGPRDSDHPMVESVRAPW